MNQLQLLQKTFKAGIALLTALILAFAGFFINLSNTSASGTPNMAVRALVSEVEDPSQGWTHNLNSQGGRTVKFYLELHNTVVGTQAQNVRVKVDLPSGVSTSKTIPVTLWADNANSASDAVVVNVINPAQGAEIRYVNGSSRLTWDENGDHILDYNQTPIPDGITSGGVRIGDQSGCNDFIIQVNFLAQLVASTPSPTPTPTPVPTPTPSPTTTGSQSQSQSQSQTQNNNQTVTVTNTVSQPAVQVTKVPVKQPETGVGVLGMLSMFTAAPFGVILSRYGRGRLVGKREEELSETASNLARARAKKTSA